MNKNDKHIKKINQRELNEKICDVTALSYDKVSAVLNSLEKNVFDRLSSASQDADVQIKLFDGLFLESKYKPTKEKRNNLTGETITVPEKLNVSGRIIRLLKKKINQ